MAEKIRMEVQITHPLAKMPYRKRDTDAGYDLFSIENLFILPGESRIVATGLKVSCPPGYFYTIEGRSSVYLQGILPNRAIIDSTYTGEITVTLYNSSSVQYHVQIGDRIAQIILSKQFDMEFDKVEDFSPEYSVRGVEGFGSTGR